MKSISSGEQTKSQELSNGTILTSQFFCFYQKLQMRFSLQDFLELSTTQFSEIVT